VAGILRNGAGFGMMPRMNRLLFGDNLRRLRDAKMFGEAGVDQMTRLLQEARQTK
jgi:hypothetical protein